MCVIDQVWIAPVFDVHSIEVWDGDHDDGQICEA